MDYKSAHGGWGMAEVLLKGLGLWGYGDQGLDSAMFSG